MASFMCEFSHVPSSGHIYFGHLKSFSPVWVLSCFYNWSDFKKLLSHFGHLKGFPPVWVLSCSFKELDLEIHLKLWALEWLLSRAVSHVPLSGQLLFKLSDFEKLLSHFEH